MAPQAIQANVFGRMTDHLQQLVSKIGRHPFVSIQHEDPRMAKANLSQAKIALRCIVVELTLHDARAETLRYGYCVVGAKGVEHDYVVAPGNRAQAVGD